MIDFTAVDKIFADLASSNRPVSGLPMMLARANRDARRPRFPLDPNPHPIVELRHLLRDYREMQAFYRLNEPHVFGPYPVTMRANELRFRRLALQSMRQKILTAIRRARLLNPKAASRANVVDFPGAKS